MAAREAAREAARGVDELERYLLRRAERHNAHADALSFTAELPWLTPAQREEVVRLYVRERTVLARHTQRLIEAALEETAARDAAAREALRRRMCVTVSALLGALALALCLLALALIPPR
ncbi:hypothetical protein FM076_04560 [Streptomyces albus subsp. chlorinus]|uniref:hypothetical protein n=1 Tax=Streptomyces albus TaxID=1888 RepID=UPI00156DED8D|nr:hypothetical protein [Streptomyces albus subsp. chlorinus]